MRTKQLLVALTLAGGAVLALALLWTLGSVAAPAGAAPPVAPERFVSPLAELRVCPAGPPSCDYASVQAAVDAAGTATVIKVAGGVYSDLHQRESITQVVYISKSVIIRGGYSGAFADPPDPAANPTVLDAGGQGRVFYISGGISVTLENLDITGGDATGLGGGQWSYDGAGGGVYVVTASVTITDCTVYDNIASHAGYGGGGGIHLLRCPATLVGNSIYSNTAGMTTTLSEGGGLVLAESPAVLTGNTIRDNIANQVGFGIGGGLYTEQFVQPLPAMLTDNIIRDNAANPNGLGHGGALFAGFGTEARMANTVLIGNVSGTTPDSQGAAIYAELSSPRLLHATIAANTGGDGSGLYLDGSTMTLTNAIIANQTVGVSLTSGSTARIDGVLWFGNGRNAGQTGTISITHAITGNPALALDGYHILSGSLAMDAGVNTAVATDIDGQSRPFGGGPDLGADERMFVTAPVIPGIGGYLTYVDARGLTGTVSIPADAVTQITYLALSLFSAPAQPAPPNLSYASYAFDLSAYREGDLLPGFAFAKPVTIAIQYGSSDVIGILEDSLGLYYWDGSTWVDAAGSCAPSSTYTRDPVHNLLSVPICHLSEYSLLGIPRPAYAVYLPLVTRQQ